jgi:LysM repeat protein
VTTPRTTLATVIALVLPLLPLAAQAKAKPKVCTHEVVAGDNLGKIALKYDLTQKQLLGENAKLAKNPDLLRLGQELDVCVDEPIAVADDDDAPVHKPSSPAGKSCGRGGRITMHEVKSGDTLAEIAEDHGVSVDAIRKRNPKIEKDPTLLQIGDALSICVDENTPAGSVKKSKLCGGRTPLFQHEVVPGEHVGQIAGRYGVRRKDIIGWNPKLGANPNLLSVGQTLRVCPEIVPRERNRMVITVAAGDNFGEIALRYGLSRNELLRFQQGKLADPSKLREGQSLVVWVDGRVVPGFGEIDDDRGVLKGGIQLPPGKGYHVKWAAAAWGTSVTVRAIQSAVAEYQRRMPGGPKIHIGDISKRHGGPFSPHLSHQHGRDVDIGYVLEGPLANETRFKTANATNLDVARTWRLIKAFIDTDQVRYIFMDYRIQKMLYEHALEKGIREELLDELFQYPRGRGRSHGIIRHWKGHSNHFHVRFRD